MIPYMVPSLVEKLIMKALLMNKIWVMIIVWIGLLLIVYGIFAPWLHFGACVILAIFLFTRAVKLKQLIHEYEYLRKHEGKIFFIYTKSKKWRSIYRDQIFPALDKDVIKVEFSNRQLDVYQHIPERFGLYLNKLDTGGFPKMICFGKEEIQISNLKGAFGYRVKLKKDPDAFTSIIRLNVINWRLNSAEV